MNSYEIHYNDKQQYDLYQFFKGYITQACSFKNEKPLSKPS